MSFGGSACPWCLGHSRRGGAAKTWLLLQQDSLGSFKMPFSVTSGMFNNSLLISVPKHGVFLVLLGFLLFFLSEQITKTQKPTDGCSLGNAKASSELLLPLPPSPPQPTLLPFYSPVATEAAKVAMLKVVPRPALNNSQ